MTEVDKLKLEFVAEFGDNFDDIFEWAMAKKKEWQEEAVKEPLESLTKWIDKCHLLQEEKQGHLEVCRFRNGLPYCKNCGLGYDNPDNFISDEQWESLELDKI